MFLQQLKSLESPESFDRYDALISDLRLSASVFEGENGNWCGEWIFENKFKANKAIKILKQNNLNTEETHGYKLPDTDWLEENYKIFKPIDIGRFFIYGSHDKERINLPAGKIHILIDAATAFGSGSHATTEGCLRMAAKYAKPTNTALDIGCGSGILSVALAKMDVNVVACDIDEEAVRVTANNIKENNVHELIKVCHSDGLSADIARNHIPYDLVFANILAGPLIEISKDICNSLEKSGVAVLSGITFDQESLIKNKYLDNKVIFVDSLQIGDWVTLVFKNAE